MPLKIIVTYSSAGSGHRRAAESIYDCFRRDAPELNVSLVDALGYTNLLFNNLYSHGYYLLAAHLRPIWTVGYHLSNFKYTRRFLNFISRLNCNQFVNLILREQPDIVLTTHFLPAALVAYLKHKGRVKSRLLTVVTDFGVHSLWVYKNCDYYIVASEHTCNCLINRGISRDKIKISGIPVSSKFSGALKQGKRRARLTALLVTGSFGFSLMEKIVNMLNSELDLIVVCGNNQGLYDRLKRKHYFGVRLFGFTEDMPELMSEADLIITKAGGLTIAEALVMELPMIFIGNIPGQETENARILSAYNCGIDAKNTKSLKDIIINLRDHPEILTSMQKNIEKLKNTDAAGAILRFITKDVCQGSV